MVPEYFMPLLRDQCKKSWSRLNGWEWPDWYFSYLFSFSFWHPLFGMLPGSLRALCLVYNISGRFGTINFLNIRTYEGVLHADRPAGRLCGHPLCTSRVN